MFHLFKRKDPTREIDAEGLRLYYHHVLCTVAVGQTETQNACGASVRPANAGAGR
mgnify:CR=1 FL=1